MPIRATNERPGTPHTKPGRLLDLAALIVAGIPPAPGQQYPDVNGQYQTATAADLHHARLLARSITSPD